MQLQKFDVLENPDDDSAVFFITPPDLYPVLFKLRFPSIVKKSRRGDWKLTSHSGSSFLSFEPNVLVDTEMEIVEEWVERFKRYVLIGLNDNIRSEFSNELDFCLALDYNFDILRDKRTLYGEAEYLLKYRGDIQYIDILSSGLLQALQELQEMFKFADPIISIVPSTPDRCSVPRKLARTLAKAAKLIFLDELLYCEKQHLKNLTFDAKIKEWERLYNSEGCIELVGDVVGKTVFLVDDLYQSGTTLWSCAKNLKQIGAAAVIGLVCVKALRDSDNQ
jgi:predicted amidophosphoribosyltransferase